MKLSIAIVGAGLSGLTIANVIGDHAEVTVFEKARGVGGRDTPTNFILIMAHGFLLLATNILNNFSLRIIHLFGARMARGGCNFRKFFS